jgi:hypothetical protein
VGSAYDTAMQVRNLGPIEMERSTFDPIAVRAYGDFALPHAVDLSGRPPTRTPCGGVRRRASAAASRGAVVSRGEMGRFVQTELAGGITSRGTRVVSAGCLAATWAPGVPVPTLYGGPPEIAASMSHYGFGWMSGEYRGVRVISHAGGTAGCRPWFRRGRPAGPNWHSASTWLPPPRI